MLFETRVLAVETLSMKKNCRNLLHISGEESEQIGSGFKYIIGSFK